MPGSQLKRKQLRQLSLSSYNKKLTLDGNDLKSKATVDESKSLEISSHPTSQEESKEPQLSMATGLSPTQSIPGSPLTEDEDRVEDDGGISETHSKSGGATCKQSWKGVPIETLRSIYVLPGPLQPSPDHIIFFRPHLDIDRPPRPYPDSYRDVLDEDHIMMPCSPRARIDDGGDNEGAGSARRRWDVVEEALRQKMTTAGDIREAILSYNKRMAHHWKFETLEAFLHEELHAKEAKAFFNDLLPQIVSAALNLPNLVTTSIPLLRCHRNLSVSFSQQQIVSLLANAFFCTFLHRSGRYGGPDIPGVNFWSLYCGPVSPRKFEKLRCILHYFRRVFDQMPTGTVSFTRRSIEADNFPNWSRLDIPLPSKLHVDSAGVIEDQGQDMLQVDFANRRIGGGVLAKGCVQEEIRFVLCPEMLLSRLFTETMKNNEALVIVGAERFSNYSGYANTFKWDGNHDDNTMRDAWGRKRTCMVAIDATRFNRGHDQYPPAALKRELDKAFVGFEWDQLPRTVATGNWGCGAFRGNHELKALLQLMACAAAKCNVCYFTFGDDDLRDKIVDIHSLLTEHGKAVKDVWRIICCYWKDCINDKRTKTPETSLYSYIRAKLNEGSDSS